MVVPEELLVEIPAKDVLLVDAAVLAKVPAETSGQEVLAEEVEPGWSREEGVPTMTMLLGPRVPPLRRRLP